MNRSTFRGPSMEKTTQTSVNKIPTKELKKIKVEIRRKKIETTETAKEEIVHSLDSPEKFKIHRCLDISRGNLTLFLENRRSKKENWIHNKSEGSRPLFEREDIVVNRSPLRSYDKDHTHRSSRSCSPNNRESGDYRYNRERSHRSSDKNKHSHSSYNRESSSRNQYCSNTSKKRSTSSSRRSTSRSKRSTSRSRRSTSRSRRSTSRSRRSRSRSRRSRSRSRKSTSRSRRSTSRSRRYSSRSGRYSSRSKRSRSLDDRRYNRSRSRRRSSRSIERMRRYDRMEYDYSERNRRYDRRRSRSRQRHIRSPSSRERHIEVVNPPIPFIIPPDINRYRFEEAMRSQHMRFMPPGGLQIPPIGLYRGPPPFYGMRPPFISPRLPIYNQLRNRNTDLNSK